MFCVQNSHKTNENRHILLREIIKNSVFTLIYKEKCIKNFKINLFMIEYKQYWSFVGGEKPKDSLAIAEKTVS